MIKIFKKATTAQTQIATQQELSTAELAQVSGGINPQPLPPNHPPEQRLK